jgi:pyridoxine kinase
MRPLQVLSVQSSVAYGHVGNNAAVFPLQRLGIEVWPVNTVQFSNHTGYGSWRGPVLPATDVAEVLAGMADLGVLAGLDAVLCGYLGTAEVGGVILDAVATVKQAVPSARYCADPVLGDRWCGFYVRPGIPEFMRDAVVPAADVTTPNQFELEYLAGRPVTDLSSLLDAADAVRANGPDVVLVTSVEVPELPPATTAMVVVTGAGAWLASTPRLELAAVSGAGDLTAALFLAHLLGGRTPAEALALVASSVFGVLETTVAVGGTEMALVAAQEHVASPRCEFEVSRLR